MFRHATQLLAAVTECHRMGIYHGDIKRHNVMVTPRDRFGNPLETSLPPLFRYLTVKLIDFGGSQLFDEARTIPTSSVGLG